jgi:hypothetical protein
VQDKPAVTLGALRVIWIVFTIAPLAYVGIGLVVAVPQPDLPLPMPLTAFLALAALGAVLVGMMLPTYLARAAGGDAGTDDLYRNAMITRWACFESVSIFGLVLAIITGQSMPLVVGAVLSVALIASARPTEDGQRASSRD